MMRACALLIFVIIGAHTAAWGARADEVSVRLRPLKGDVTITGFNLEVSGEKRKPTMGFRRVVLSAADLNRSLPIEIRGVQIRVDLRPAPNHIQIVRKKDQFSLIGLMPLEDYLEGVVASEVPKDWPEAALKAQAVAARSFALAKIREREALGPAWLLESNVTDQVFDIERKHTRAASAVRATEGEVLVTGSNEVVSTHYHSDCGGQTEESLSVWGGGARSGTATDRSCENRKTWRLVRGLSDLAKSLSLKGLVPESFRLASLSVSRVSPNGRVLELEARDSQTGRSRRFSGEKLREALGYSDLKSTLFGVRVVSNLSENQIEFSGRGFGHGVGLCQWGARALALKGQSYREILSHYYPKLQLTIRGSGVSPQAQMRHSETLPRPSQIETML